MLEESLRPTYELERAAKPEEKSDGAKAPLSGGAAFKSAMGYSLAKGELSNPDANNPPVMMVRTQTASCPDAQCPRAKMENVGYAAKGYNLMFGNPFPTRPGVDPGFYDHAGGLIWALEYSDDGETTDGRFQVPDKLSIEHNVGCVMDFSTTESTTMDMVKASNEGEVGVDASASGMGYSGAFSANVDWNTLESQMQENHLTKVTSTADCVVYHIKFPWYSIAPKITHNFYYGLMTVDAKAKDATGAGKLKEQFDCDVPKPTPKSYSHEAFERGDQIPVECSEKVRTKMINWCKEDGNKGACRAFWVFFDEFGTHWSPYLQMGARFGLETVI